MDKESAKAFLAYVLMWEFDPETIGSQGLSVIRSLVHAAGCGVQWDFAYMTKFYELPDFYEDKETTTVEGNRYVIQELVLFVYSGVVVAELKCAIKPDLKAELDESVSGMLDQCYQVAEALGWHMDYLAEYQRAANTNWVPREAVNIFIRELLEDGGV